MLKLWRLLLGYVEFEITGKFPERFLNLAYSSGINIWGQLPESGKITARMPLRSYKRIRPVAKKAGVRLKIRSKRGLPIFLRRHSDRSGLAVGLALLLVLLGVLNDFVWVINIQTSPSIDCARLKSALKENGVTVGAYKKSIDVLSVERRLMREVGQLSWAAVNIVGTTASIEIKSKEEAPDTSAVNLPCNIKAARDGVILKLDVQNGRSLTSAGSGVTQGQLLVSGVLESSSGSSSLVRASAQITARTSRTEKFFAPAERVTTAPTGRAYFRCRLNLLWLSTPNTPALLPDSTYCRSAREYRAQVNGALLPAGFTVEENIEYLPQEFTFSQARQRENAYKKTALYEAFYLPDAEVEARDISENQSSGGFTLTVKYTCIEDIAEPSPIYICASSGDLLSESAP